MARRTGNWNVGIGFKRFLLLMMTVSHLLLAFDEENHLTILTMGTMRSPFSPCGEKSRALCECSCSLPVFSSKYSYSSIFAATLVRILFVHGLRT